MGWLISCASWRMVAWALTLRAVARCVFGRGGEVRSAARGKCGSPGGRMCTGARPLYRHSHEAPRGELAAYTQVQGTGTRCSRPSSRSPRWCQSWPSAIFLVHLQGAGGPLGLLSTVPFAWRAGTRCPPPRSCSPRTSACIYAAAPDQAAFQPFVALTLTAYSVGSRAEGRRAMWAPPVLAVASVPVFVAAVCTGRTRQHRPVPRLAGGGVGGRADRPELAAQEHGAGTGEPRARASSGSCKRRRRSRSSGAGSRASCTTWSRTTCR